MSSAFTVKDDEHTPFHSGNAQHEEELRSGNMAPSTQLTEVVLGPGAFGSPDPATLGHHLLADPSLSSGPALSADVDEDDEDEGSDEPDESMKKDELLVMAAHRGVDADESMTKAEIVQAIKDAE